MTLDWPLVVLLLGVTAASVIVARPFVVGRTTSQVQRAALEDITKRLNAVEAHLAGGARKWPGRL